MPAAAPRHAPSRRRLPRPSAHHCHPEHDGSLSPRTRRACRPRPLPPGHLHTVTQPATTGPAAPCAWGVVRRVPVRVDDTPGGWPHGRPPRHGRSQNASPRRASDVFRLTDWFFPKHLDHHHFDDGLAAPSTARCRPSRGRWRVTGSLPNNRARSCPRRKRDEIDVLVVGAGSLGDGRRRRRPPRRGPSPVLVVKKTTRLVAPFATADDRARPRCPRRLRRSRAPPRLPPTTDATLVLPIRWCRPRPRPPFANGCHDTVGTFGRNDSPRHLSSPPA